MIMGLQMIRATISNPVFVPTRMRGGDGILSPGETWTYTFTTTALDLSQSIDFDEDADGNPLAAGTIVSTQYADFGVTITATGFGAMIFNSANPTGGDIDLGTPNQTFGGPGIGVGGEAGTPGENSRALGNVLIVSEDGDSSDPDDNAGGGTLTFEFAQPVFVGSLQLLDIEESGGQVVTRDADGAVIASYPIPALGNNSFQVLSIGDQLVSEVQVIFAGSGAVAELQYRGIYKNIATVMVGDVTDDDPAHYTNPKGQPAIDIEKSTNDVDADTADEAPEIPVGATVTWTYVVTNTGNVPFSEDEVVIVDDAGTPNDLSDDFSTASGRISRDTSTDAGMDGILSPGEMWTYTATDTAENLTGVSGPLTFNFSGNSGLDGNDGNTRTFTAGSVSVKTSAFSRDKSNGAWSEAFLGSYSGGLGVTDSSEGNGSNNTHTVDNVGRDNYVLFEFSEEVIVDRATLGYVVNDSDLSIWIGTVNDPINHHLTLSDSVLSNLGFTEVDLTNSSNPRTADINAGGVSGNVLVIAAWTGDDTPEDRFKIEKIKINQVTSGIYKNMGVVTVPGATDSDPSHYRNLDEPQNPHIDIEKFTNGKNADTEADAQLVAAGSSVTWTYEVSNTGNVPFTLAQVTIVDDAGTPNLDSDDFSTSTGDILLDGATDVGSDGILSPGETWTYFATGIGQNLTTMSSARTFDFSGNSGLNGTDGNIRTFNSGPVSVKTSAFSRDKSSGAWAPAFLGSYSGGLGVTDSSEGNGSNNTHTVDNVGRDNYVLFEFSEQVIVDRATLGYVVNDSDLSIWIGNLNDPFNNHVQLSDAVLSGLGFTEVDLTNSSRPRTANINNGDYAGNVLVIAAWTGDTTPEDRFKIEKLKINQISSGFYKNIAVVSVPGATDNDPSHYRNPNEEPQNPSIAIEKFTNGKDADTQADAQVIAAGETVTWTYKVMNTGNVPFTLAQVSIVDDAGTPSVTTDDFSTLTGDILLNGGTDVGGDGILSPGESWTYFATDTAEDLRTMSANSVAIDFSGNSALDGTNGNVRTFSEGSVSVRASAFSRTKGNDGNWATAYLGSYSGGLGVTDRGEGSGGNNKHTVDNIGRDNYVLFEFSEEVVVDKATLGYVVNDSDLSIWIGTVNDPFNNHLRLSDSLLDGFFTEVNLTDLSGARTADINSGQLSGNVLVIAAWTGDSTPEDRFKIEKLKVNQMDIRLLQEYRTCYCAWRCDGSRPQPLP